MRFCFLNEFFFSYIKGVHYRLYNKPVEDRFILQQPVLVPKKETKMLERMAGRYYKKLKIDRFVDKPFTLYHPYIKNENKKMFYP